MSKAQAVKELVGEQRDVFVKGVSMFKFDGITKTEKGFRYNLVDLHDGERYGLTHFNNCPSHDAIKGMDMKRGESFKVSGGIKLKLWNNSEYLNIDNDCGIDAVTKAELPTIAEDPIVLENAVKHCGFINDTIGEIQHHVFGIVTKAMWDEYSKPYSVTAAAHGHHHAHKRGLMEHVYEMLVHAKALITIGNLSQFEQDLMLTGIIWHDVGKIFETKHVLGSPEPTKKGFLLGHMGAGCQILYNTCSKCGVDWFEDGSIDHLAHIIYSHHGLIKWGSPVEPKTIVARMVHDIDNMSAKTNALYGLVEKGSEVIDGVYYGSKMNLVDVSEYE